MQVRNATVDIHQQATVYLFTLAPQADGGLIKGVALARIVSVRDTRLLLSLVLSDVNHGRLMTHVQQLLAAIQGQITQGGLLAVGTTEHLPRRRHQR